LTTIHITRATVHGFPVVVAPFTAYDAGGSLPNSKLPVRGLIKSGHRESFSALSPSLMT